MQGCVARRVRGGKGGGRGGGKREEVGQQGGVRGAGGEHQLQAESLVSAGVREEGDSAEEDRMWGTGDGEGAIQSQRPACSSTGHSAETSSLGAWLRPPMFPPRARAGCPSWHSC